MRIRSLLRAAIVFAAFSLFGSRADAGPHFTEAAYLPDVVGQFNALSVRADALGMIRGTSPNPSSCKHYQGIVRVHGADGTPFFLVTRSGNTPPIPGLPDGLICDDSPGETDHGHLIVFKMASRDITGERLRSNRLQKGLHVDDTLPDLEDVATIFFSITDSGLVFRNGDANNPVVRSYGHPGGMQVVGDILALPLESPESSASPLTQVMFLNISDPEAPELRSQYALIDETNTPLGVAGSVALAALADGHYLMMVTGGSNNPALYFYRSNSTDLGSEALTWTLTDTWHADINRQLPGFPTDICGLAGSQTAPTGNCLSADEQYLEQNWPDGNDGFTHQTLQFFREQDINGSLYLAGARGRILSDSSIIDLYRVDCESALCDTGDIRLKRISTRNLVPRPNTGGEKLASFAAGSTFYVSPSGELLFYATEHDNDGPQATDNDESGSIKAGEWRHKEVVRPQSTTLLPTAMVDGPFNVDEGSQVQLSGAALPPLTKAFVQLFHDTNFGSYSVMVDYDDRDRDDFDDFDVLELQVLPTFPTTFFTHNDKARSWNWFAPSGCSILAVDRYEGSVDETRTLSLPPGAEAQIQRDPDLANVLNDGGTDDIDQEVDRVEFLPDCASYYSTPFVLRWDMDGNGSFETTGNLVDFDASGLDGPSVAAVEVSAEHPSGGPAGVAGTYVTVSNVSPILSTPVVVDSLGLQVNVEVPFVLTGLPISVSAQFTDPGIPDRQTASIDWSDGLIDENAAFREFDEAYGDGAGHLLVDHRYLFAGEFQVALSVDDDDGGTSTQTMTVRVVTPAQALEEIVGLIDAAISLTTDKRALASLDKARKAIAGSNAHSNNGALNKIQNGNVSAAKAMIRTAINGLLGAAVGGTNVGLLISILRQIDSAL